MLILSTARLCSLNLSLRRRLVSPIYCIDADNGRDGVWPAVCTLPMVRCGSSPVARPYHAKNEAPGGEAVPAILNNRPIRLTQCCTQFKSLGVLRFFVYCICIIMWHSHLNDVEIPETKRFIPKGMNWVQHWVSRISLLFLEPEWPPRGRRPNGLLIQRPWGRKE